MIHKGVEYTMTLAAPGVWNWQFRIGDKVRSGKTEARLQLLAMRRVQLRIDRELKKAEQEQAPGAEIPALAKNSSGNCRAGDKVPADRANLRWQAAAW